MLKADEPLLHTEVASMQEMTLDDFPDLKGWVETACTHRTQFLDASHMANQLCKPRGGKKTKKA